MSKVTTSLEDRGGRGRYSPGFRIKLLGFLLPLVFLLILSVAMVATEITESSLRWDLIQRGAAISHVVAHSAGYSLLSEDHLGLDRLVSETKAGGDDIEFVSVQGADDTVVAHSRLEERGKPLPPPEKTTPLGSFHDTRADAVYRNRRSMIEFTTPILFSGRQVGTVSLGVSRRGLLASQQHLRKSIGIAAAGILAIAVIGTLILSSFITRPVKRLTAGVNELAGGGTFHPIPVHTADELGELTRNFNRMAKTITDQKDALGQYARELEEAYISIVRLLAASIDARDPYTLGHSNRVAMLSCNLARWLGLPEDEVGHVEKAALFHDVGKLGTPDDVLLKGDTLSPLESEVMRRHPEGGAEILAKAPSLRRYIEVVRAHHEWYDGRGYPEGRRAGDIPLHAQIIAIADAYDAMTSTRPYRKALSPGQALEEIARFRGTQFAPALTDAFIAMVEESTALAAAAEGGGMPI